MTNRYGDKVEFIPISDTEIEFRVTQPNGEPSPYWRFGSDSVYIDDNKVYTMADPSGGPYISKGLDLGVEDKNLRGKIVKYITNNNKVIIHI